MPIRILYDEGIEADELCVYLGENKEETKKLEEKGEEKWG